MLKGTQHSPRSRRGVRRAGMQSGPAFVPTLSVPVDAVVDSGLEKRVFLQTAENHFEPRMVETGWQIGDRVQIVSGLHEGDVVVASGTFLVDSESRLHSDARPAASAAIPHVTSAAEHSMN